MKEITLAIPFYNTSRYFEEAVSLAIESDFVKEIVVNDDCSQVGEWDNLCTVVEKLKCDKIRYSETMKILVDLETSILL